MTKQIYVFTSLDDAISVLSKFGKEFIFPQHSFSKNEIVNRSVASNIFRAFHNLDTSPSVIYRSWAKENFDSILSDLKSVDSPVDYYNYIEKYSDLLIQEWAEVTANPNSYLMYGPASKMINLLIKWIQESETLKQPDKLKYQQIPFDSFSLQPIRLIINELSDVKYRISIPPNASMGFINTPQLYSILMDSVYSLCKLSKINPIVFDYWAWEDKHI